MTKPINTKGLDTLFLFLTFLVAFLFMANLSYFTNLSYVEVMVTSFSFWIIINQGLIMTLLFYLAGGRRW